MGETCVNYGRSHGTHATVLYSDTRLDPFFCSSNGVVRRQQATQKQSAKEKEGQRVGFAVMKVQKSMGHLCCNDTRATVPCSGSTLAPFLVVTCAQHEDATEKERRPQRRVTWSWTNTPLPKDHSTKRARGRKENKGEGGHETEVLYGDK